MKKQNDMADVMYARENDELRATVIKLVDKLGGIDVYSDYNFSRNGYNFKKGYNHINGDAALVFTCAVYERLVGVYVVYYRRRYRYLSYT